MTAVILTSTHFRDRECNGNQPTIFCGTALATAISMLVDALMRLLEVAIDMRVRTCDEAREAA
jgi:hypothetical protein